MIIERTEREIRFRFEPGEWKIRDRAACHDFIYRIKPYISQAWDPETKFWTIDRRQEELFEQLRKELFEDPNQPSLF